MLRALVVSFDRLHLGYLGCYGNEWVETPNFDRLAAEAVTFDRHYIETCEPVSRDHPWWTGTVSFLGRTRTRPDLFEQLTAANVQTRLFVETDGHDGGQTAPAFDEIIEVRGRDGLDVSDEQTPFARLVDRVLEELPRLAASDKPELVWLKSRGVPVPWLPPQQLADLYLDEFGLSPDQSTAVIPGDPYEEPEEVWHADSGQSIDLKFARALYAAYVTHLDRWFGRLMQGLERAWGRDDLLLIVTAAAGEPLGEHGELDVRRDLLREEVMHAPLWVRVPEKSFDASRRPALVQPADILPTLVDWFAPAPPPLSKGEPGGVAPPELDVAESKIRRIAASNASPCLGHGGSLLPLVRLEVESIRDAAVMASADESGLRTDDYFLVEPASRGKDEAERQHSLLFAKPHDRWDQADIAGQFPQVAEELRNELRSKLVGRAHQPS